MLVRSLVCASLLLLAACGHDHGGPVCTEIAETCHDSTSEEGIACHEFAEAEDVTEEECEEKKADCLAACP